VRTSMGLAGRVLSEALASPSPVVGEELHDAGPSEDHAAQHMLAVSIVVLIVLLLLSLAIGQWLHSKHIYYIPESGVTFISGFVSGYFVSAWFGTDSEQEETLLYFDPMFFTLFLLPPIIFEAGYSLDMPLFKKNLPKILALAILGTLISAAVTWYALYTDATDFLIDLSLTESGQFAALISAIDPVATLSLFSALKVDPSLNNIVVGESVLNDAVALISFRAVTHFGINMKDEWEAIILSFVVTGVGSSIVGLTIGFSAALLFKLMGMGKPNRSDLPHVECVAFVMFAYVSFVAAELSDNSGIVSALFAGFTMRAYARPNLSQVARPVVDALLKVMSSMADSIIYLLVGFAITIELEYVTNADKDGTTLSLQDASEAFVYVVILAVLVRALYLFPILGGFNLFAKPDDRVPLSQQIICWFSGLRGAIAVALAYEVPGDNLGGTPNNKHIIRAATMMVVVFTTFAFGGPTPCLLKLFKIRTGVEPDGGDEDARPRPDGILGVLEDTLVDPECKARGYKRYEA